MSCLFNSLSYFISETSNNIRQKICDYIEQNKPILEGIETKDIITYEENNYIANMRSTNTWGGAIELQAACNIWKCKIIVHNIRDNPKTKIEFIPVSEIIENIENIENKENVFELEWSGGHYEPVRKNV